MNVFILTDLEGVAGIDDIAQMERGTPLYEASCQRLTQELNLAVNASFESGADRVYYLDGHAGGGNVKPEAVDCRAVACKLSDWEALLADGAIDCVIELGAHARAGTVGGFLDHTINSKRNFYIKINGTEMSEFSLHAIFCAHFGVPIVGLVGDRAACEQAKEYLPTLITGAVKEATVRNVATSYPGADEILVKTVKAALAGRNGVGLIAYETPLLIEQAFYRTDMCEEAMAACTVAFERLNARTLQKTVSAPRGYRDLFFK